MASSADIETALVNAVAGVLYPDSGPAFAGTVSVARGWPTEADVRKAVTAGAHLIGIYAVSGMSRDVTKTLRNWQPVGNGMGAIEVARIEQIFRLDIWASTPDARDSLLGRLIPALKFQTRYALPDGTTATLMRSQAGGPNDRPSRADEWAQSIDLMLQYPIFYTETQTAVVNAPTLNAVVNTEIL